MPDMNPEKTAITALICDDEPLARERMAAMLSRIDQVRLCEEQAENGEQALDIIRRLLPDVVLLDIEMPGMDGLSCATAISAMATPPAIIFCTAYTDYALEAFKAQGDNYLLKPIRQQELEQALARVQRLNRSQMAQQRVSAQESQKAECISAKSHKGIELIPIDDITLFQAGDKYVTACHSHGEALIEESLKSLQERLGESFLRIHRNALVATKAIQGMNRGSQGVYTLQVQGQQNPVAISRRHLSSVRRWLQKPDRS